MKSIQSKFLTIIVSGILILALVITAISFFYTNRMLENDSDMITESVAAAETQRINGILRDVEYIVKSMENHCLSAFESPDQLADQAFCEQYSESAQTAFHAVVGNFGEIAGYYLRFSPDLAYSTTAGFFVTKTEGSTNAYVELTPTDLSDRFNPDSYQNLCWYLEPEAAGKAIWMKPYLNVTSRLPIVSYVIPIYIDETIIGVVGVDVKYAAITDMVSGISVYDNGFAYLTYTSSGEIAYSPVDEHKLISAAEHHGYAEVSNELVNGMTLVIHADYSDIQSNSYRMLMMQLFISLAFIGLFAFITLILSQNVIKPLKKLTAAAEQLAEGDTNVDLEHCDTNDEVAILTDAFMKTAENLRGYMSYINALAYKDGLTGVKNRTAYNEIYAELDLKIKRGNCEPFAIMVADINGLKATNDKYGHEIGNKLIIKTAKIICDVFKHSPVFRIGGDEFVILLRDEDLANNKELLCALDTRFESTVVSSGNTDIPVRAAYAIAEFDSVHDIAFEDVFSRADKKMYENKNKIKDSATQLELI